MKPGSITSALIAVVGLAIAALSASLLGVGVWGLAILAVSLVIAISPYVDVLMPLAKGMAAFFAVIAVLAILLGLLAATTGGTFRLPADQALLLFLFGVYAILCIVFSRTKHIEMD